MGGNAQYGNHTQSMGIYQGYVGGEKPLPYPWYWWTVEVSGEESGDTMSVIKRDNSKHWYIQFQLNQKTYIKSSRTTDKRVAEQMEREWRRKLHAQDFLGEREPITIFNAMNLYLDSKKGTPGYSTLRYHMKIVNRLMNTHRYLHDLASEDLEKFKSTRQMEGKSPQTIKHHFNLIRGSVKHANRMGYKTPELSYLVIKLPKYKLRYLSQEEEKRLLEELNPHREGSGLKPYEIRQPQVKRFMHDAYDLVVMLLDTGARYTEIADMEWKQINLDNRTIHLWRPKVQNQSILFMTDRVYRILSRRCNHKSSPYVFTNQKGEKRGYSSVCIRKAFRRAGLGDCTIHTLRHTLASRLIQNGMSIYEVKEILGHADIKTTMRYAHLEQQEVSSRARDVINKINTQIEKPDLKVV